jgi:hypothetical protein
MEACKQTCERTFLSYLLSNDVPNESSYPSKKMCSILPCLQRKCENSFPSFFLIPWFNLHLPIISNGSNVTALKVEVENWTVQSRGPWARTNANWNHTVLLTCSSPFISLLRFVFATPVSGFAYSDGANRRVAYRSDRRECKQSLDDIGENGSNWLYLL